jgi:uncharacterized SAM-binding protein YcdF (DUF218 family)
MTLGFWLKKTIGYWLMPLPLVLLVAAIGTGLVLLSRWRRTGVALLVLAFLLLGATSNRAVGTWLVAPLETAHPALPALRQDSLPASLRDVTAVVVPGGGHSATPDRSAVVSLSASALGRLTEGLRVARALPDARLVLCGPFDPDAPDAPSHAEVMARAAEELGFPRSRMVLLPHVRDTADEARETARILGPARIALATSAWHMDRAKAEFESAGLEVLPCPCDYVTRGPALDRWTDLGWDLGGLERSTKAVYETLGRAWQRLRPGSTAVKK